MEMDQNLMKKAEKRVRDKTGFYIHFACYLLVNISLIIFWVSIVQPGSNLIPLVFGPLFGWGVGIVAHFIAVFYGPSEERVQKEYEKIQNKKK